MILASIRIRFRHRPALQKTPNPRRSNAHPKKGFQGPNITKNHEDREKEGGKRYVDANTGAESGKEA